MKDGQKNRQDGKQPAGSSGGKQNEQHPPGMTRTGPGGDPTGAPFGDDEAQDAASRQRPGSKPGQGSQR
jgi:hypothetical protein